MMIELKSCPFCGGGAQLRKWDNGYCTGWKVGCGHCNLFFSGEAGAGQMEVSLLWNARRAKQQNTGQPGYAGEQSERHQAEASALAGFHPVQLGDAPNTASPAPDYTGVYELLSAILQYPDNTRIGYVKKVIRHILKATSPAPEQPRAGEPVDESALAARLVVPMGRFLGSIGFIGVFSGDMARLAQIVMNELRPYLRTTPPNLTEGEKDKVVGILGLGYLRTTGELQGAAMHAALSALLTAGYTIIPPGEDGNG